MSKKHPTKCHIRTERHTSSPAPVTMQDKMDLIDSKLEDIAGEMDRDYMAYGKTCAKLFRAMVDAAVALPDMELYTSLLTVDNNSDTLTVILKRGKLEKMCHHEQEEDDSGNNKPLSEPDGKRFVHSCKGCNGCSGCPGPGNDDDWEEDEEENLREY
jgi:hypothetical protein